MAKLANLARMTTATTGTGTITLGAAATGYLSFADSGIANGDVVTYAIVDGSNREIGRGTYTSAGTTLSRDTILESTNGGSAISLTGNAQVFITAAAEDITRLAVRVRKAADQTAANYSGAGALVAWDDEDFDDADFHDNSVANTRLTIQAGRGIRRVRLTAGIRASSNTVSTYHSFVIQKNGGADGETYGSIQGMDGGSTFIALNIDSGPIAVADGDYFECIYIEESDTSVTIEREGSFFSLEVIG